MIGSPLARTYHVRDPGADFLLTPANSTDNIDTENLTLTFTPSTAKVLALARLHIFRISGSAIGYMALNDGGGEITGTRTRMVAGTHKLQKTFQYLADVTPGVPLTWSLAWRCDTASQLQTTLVADLDAYIEFEVFEVDEPAGEAITGTADDTAAPGSSAATGSQSTTPITGTVAASPGAATTAAVAGSDMTGTVASSPGAARTLALEVAATSDDWALYADTERPDRWDLTTRPGSWNTTTFVREDRDVALTTVAYGPFTENEVPEALLVRCFKPLRAGGSSPMDLFAQTPNWDATVSVLGPTGPASSRSAEVMDPADLTTDYPDDFSGSEDGWVRVVWQDSDFTDEGAYQIQVTLDNGIVRLKSTDVWVAEVNSGPASDVV